MKRVFTEEEHTGVNEFDALLRLLVVKTAPVMMKVRPAMLIRLTNGGLHPDLRFYDHFCRYRQEIISTLRTDFLILQNDGINLQVMFFDRPALMAHLNRPDIRTWLDNHGYRDLHTPGQLLGLLRRRFGSGKFPHEIGIFLGYPLKDVAGFMAGRTDAVPISRSLWRVFDDPFESLQMMRMYRIAEEIGRAALRHCRDIDQSIDLVRKTIYT